MKSVVNDTDGIVRVAESVIPEIHYPESQEVVSAIPRVGVHGEVLP